MRAMGVVLTVLMVSMTAAAGDAGGREGRRAEMRARVEGKIHAYLSEELRGKLGLDEAKANKLSDALTAHMKRKQERRARLREEMKTLRGLVDQKAPDAKLKAQLDVVLGLSGRDDDMQQFIGETQKFLSVAEQAKLALAVPEIVKDVQGMVRDARRAGRGLRGGGGPPDEE